MIEIKQLKKLHRILYRTFFMIFIIKDYFKFKKMLFKNSRFEVSLVNTFPQIFDKTITTSYDRHYVYHTAWAARKVKEINPKEHIDISSSLFFSSIVSAFVPTKFYDYRPAVLNLSNLQSYEGNLLKLPFEDYSVFSLSCMHTIEHVGLGRYGDEIDPDGDIKAINELKRVVAFGGNILFVTPVGKQILRFNAHRVYAYESIVKYFEGFELVEFSLIHEYEENGGLTINATKALSDSEEYGCGCFWFKKV